MCAEGLVLCGEDCVDLARDPLHCGGCGASCLVGVPCQDGVCDGLPPVVDGVEVVEGSDVSGPGLESEDVSPADAHDVGGDGAELGDPLPEKAAPCGCRLQREVPLAPPALLTWFLALGLVSLLWRRSRRGEGKT